MNWISVKDKLPEEDTLVVAAHIYESDSIPPDAAVCWFLHGSFHFWDDGTVAENFDGGAEVRLDMTITHWFALPCTKGVSHEQREL